MSHQESAMTEQTARLRALVEQWRAIAADVDTFHATMGIGYKGCADQLESLLSILQGEGERPQKEDGQVERLRRAANLLREKGWFETAKDVDEAVAAYPRKGLTS